MNIETRIVGFRPPRIAISLTLIAVILHRSLDVCEASLEIQSEAERDRTVDLLNAIRFRDNFITRLLVTVFS